MTELVLVDSLRKRGGPPRLVPRQLTLCRCGNDRVCAGRCAVILDRVWGQANAGGIAWPNRQLIGGVLEWAASGKLGLCCAAG